MICLLISVTTNTFPSYEQSDFIRLVYTVCTYLITYHSHPCDPSNLEEKRSPLTGAEHLHHYNLFSRIQVPSSERQALFMALFTGGCVGVAHNPSLRGVSHKTNGTFLSEGFANNPNATCLFKGVAHYSPAFISEGVVCNPMQPPFQRV